MDSHSLYYVVGQLHNYSLIDAKRDAIADAFETFIGYTLKGPQGQFFTPRNVVKLMVNILNQNTDEKVIDPMAKNPLYKKWMIASILEDASGMAGTEIIRRTIGDSKVKEIESIESIEARVYMDKFLILLGKSLIKDRYKIKTGKDYVALIDKIKKII